VCSFKIRKRIESIYTGEAIALSTRGRLLVTAALGRVYVQDLFDSGESLKLFEAPAMTMSAEDDEEDEDVVLCVAVDDVSGRLYVAMRSLFFYQFDLVSGEVCKTWKPHDAGVLLVQPSYDGSFFITASADGTLKAWRTLDCSLIHVYRGHGRVIRSVALSLDGKTLYSGGDDGTIRMWDIGTATCLAIGKGAHTSAVTQLLLSPCGKLLTSVSRDQVAYIWSIQHENQIKSQSKKKDERKGALAIYKTIPVYEAIEAAATLEHCTDKNKWSLCTASQTGTLKVWDPVTGSISAQYSFDGTPLIHACFALVHDGVSYILTATSDHIITLFNYKSSAAKYFLTQVRHIIGCNQEVTDAAFLSERLVAIATNTPLLRLYDLESGAATLIENGGHKDMLLCLASHPTAPGWLISGSKDRRACVWRLSLETGQLILVATLEGHTQAIGAVSLYCQDNSANLSFVVTASQDRTMKVWQPSNSSSSTTEMWRTRFTIRAHEKDINCVDATAHYIVTGSQDKTAKVWHSDTGALIGTLSGHRRGIWSCKFTGSGSILTSSADKTIRLWSTTGFQCLRTFEGHAESVLRVSLLPASSDNKPAGVVVSSGADALLKTWDLQSAVNEGTFEGHRDKIWALAVSPSGKCLVTGGTDATLIIWQDDTEEKFEAAHRERTQKILDEEAFTNFVHQQDFKNALALALSKKQPFRLLTLLHDLTLSVTNGDDDQSAFVFSADVDLMLKNLSVEQLATLVSFLKDWNTQFRHLTVCQGILTLLFTSYTKQTLCAIPGFKTTLNSLIAYNERYHARYDEAMIQFHLIDLYLQNL
jgi:U3 small nucleolar RNA-associated protein 13